MIRLHYFYVCMYVCMYIFLTLALPFAFDSCFRDLVAIDMWMLVLFSIILWRRRRGEGKRGGEEGKGGREF